LRHGPKSATGATARKILANQSVGNDPGEVMRVVAPFGGNVHAALEVGAGAAALTRKYRAEQLIAKSGLLVELAHAGCVARMKQTPDKSDWTDAGQDFRLQASGKSIACPPKSEVGSLKPVDRHGLVEQRKQVKLRLRALLRNHRIVCPHSPWTIKGKAWLPDETNIPSRHYATLHSGFYCDHFDTIGYFTKKNRQRHRKNAGRRD
jgi:hypothetical protein